MEKVVFIFVWRISREKWVHLIFEAAQKLVDHGYINFTIDFIWSGRLVDELMQHPLYGIQLFYHGRLPKEQTIMWMSKAQYTLMPSLFLETFGLVALDSLASGIPVIGEKKGGLTPFIIDEHLVITQQHSLYDCMQYVLLYTDEVYLHWLQKKALEIASTYTTQKRLDRFWQLSKKCKKLLLVSDYAKDIWWIENYLFQIQWALLKQWVSCDLFWKTERVTWWWRKLDLLIAGMNLYAGLALWKKVTNKSYELIWLHSVQRRFGRLSLAFLWCTKKQPIRCMYHDFWLLHPFPSSVYWVDQLDRAQSFWWYVQEGKHILWVKKWYCWWRCLVVAKYIYSAWMFFWLQKVVDLHLVPSAYLLPYMQKKLTFSAQIEVFPHFVSHARDV